jgi:hypothetical protein
LILVRFTGGLGNQLFQYAFAKSVALKNNVELKFDVSLLGNENNVKDIVVRHFDLDVFKLPEQWTTKQEIALFNGYANPTLYQKLVFKKNQFFKRHPLVVQKRHEFDLKQIQSIGKEACLVGRWQSEDFFIEHKDSIKKAFDFSHFTPNAYSHEVAAQMKETISVSVQVRRGDYVTHPHYSKTIGALSAKYYFDAIEYVKSKLSNEATPFFYFISDDIHWCKENFGHLQHVVFVEQEKSKVGYLSDLWLLTQSQHAILSNSTFAWWGAWLGENEKSIIVAPQTWLRELPPNSCEFVPSRWHTLPNSFEPLFS